MRRRAEDRKKVVVKLGWEIIGGESCVREMKRRRTDEKKRTFLGRFSLRGRSNQILIPLGFCHFQPPLVISQPSTFMVNDDTFSF